MNVTFHTLTALAVAAVLSSKEKVPESAQLSSNQCLPVLAGGFCAGVLLHGLLDFVPHQYPIRSHLDISFSLVLFTAAIALSKRRHRILIATCFFGVIFPDLVDLGPAIVNKHLGWSVPVVTIFPWHWHQYSGSIYDGTGFFKSLFLHVAVVGTSLGLLYRCRSSLFAFGE